MYDCIRCHKRHRDHIPGGVSVHFVVSSEQYGHGVHGHGVADSAAAAGMSVTAPSFRPGQDACALPTGKSAAALLVKFEYLLTIEYPAPAGPLFVGCGELGHKFGMLGGAV